MIYSWQYPESNVYKNNTFHHNVRYNILKPLKYMTTKVHYICLISLEATKSYRAFSLLYMYLADRRLLIKNVIRRYREEDNSLSSFFSLPLVMIHAKWNVRFRNIYKHLFFNKKISMIVIHVKVKITITFNYMPLSISDWAISSSWVTLCKTGDGDRRRAKLFGCIPDSTYKYWWKD